MHGCAYVDCMYAECNYVDVRPCLCRVLCISMRARLCCHMLTHRQAHGDHVRHTHGAHVGGLDGEQPCWFGWGSWRPGWRAQSRAGAWARWPRGPTAARMTTRRALPPAADEPSTLKLATLPPPPKSGSQTLYVSSLTTSAPPLPQWPRLRRVL